MFSVSPSSVGNISKRFIWLIILWMLLLHVKYSENLISITEWPRAKNKSKNCQTCFLYWVCHTYGIKEAAKIMNKVQNIHHFLAYLHTQAHRSVDICAATEDLKLSTLLCDLIGSHAHNFAWNSHFLHFARPMSKVIFMQHSEAWSKKIIGDFISLFKHE